jgi:hypothetical protein
MRNNWSMYNAINQQHPTEHSVHFDQSKNMTYEYHPTEDNIKHSGLKSRDSAKKDERASIGGTSTLGAVSSSVLSGIYAPTFPKEELKDATKLNISSNYHHIPTFEPHQNPTFNNYVFES